MKFVKGLALSLLGFLLFLSLSVFGLMFMLNSTVLSPDFVAEELDKIDVYSLAGELLREQVPQDQPYVTKVLDDTLADLEPWLKEQVNTIIYAGYDYLMGRRQHLDLAIPMEPVRDSLKENLRQAVLESPPPELQGAPPGTVELYLNEVYRQIDEQIPSTFEFSPDALDPDVIVQLEQVRKGIGYFQIGYKVLIGFILLLIVGIILLYREVRGATRSLGITFLTCGVITYLYNLAAKHFTGTLVVQNLPAPLQTRLPQLVSDFLAPLDMYALILAAIGIALLIVSFVYKPRQAAF